MGTTSRAFLLGPLLKGVSRSFYLTLAVLPRGMRDPIGLAYLLARAADTIADTSLIAPGERSAMLASLRAQINGTAGAQPLNLDAAAQHSHADEKVLLESIGPALDVLAQLSASDRAAVRGIVATLMDGMAFDLDTFPDEQSGRIVALREYAELDRYTYLVAGCVGEFWTAMTYAHLPGTLTVPPAIMSARGIRFGKALQLVNVLRDCGKDLRIGRCYFPSTLLDRYELTPSELLLGGNSVRARPLQHELVRHALVHFREALDYTLAIPALSMRLRLACVWPIVIGLKTLLLLVQNDRWLDPQHVSKITRNDVYRVIAASLPAVVSDTLVRRWIERLIGRVETAMAAQ